MKKIIIFTFAIFLTVLLFSCHSLPPSTPSTESPDSDEYLYLTKLNWQTVSMPTDLLGDWYSEGKLDLTVTEDTLYVYSFRTLIQSVAKADIYYRIIYNVETLYNAVYFRNLTDDKIQIAYTDSNSVDMEGAAGLPVVARWYILTSTNPWIPTNRPPNISGNWHIRDGKLELVIAQENVVIDGESWQIDAIETNRTVDRLVLKSGEKYKSLYFGEINEYEMEALLLDGREDIQDRYGRIGGDWITLYKWWDLFEIYPFSQGSRWTYMYSYWEYYNQVYNQSSPIDSIVQEHRMGGLFELEVTTNTIIDAGSGSLNLQATFRIDEDWNRYFHARIDSVTQTVADSQWLYTDVMKIRQYEIFLENDTLWYNTEQGKVFFASRKGQPGSLINLRAFVFPFTFPKEGFPEGMDILGRTTLFYGETIWPIPDWVSEWREYELRTDIILGSDTDKDVFIRPGKGVVAVYYLHGDYNRPYKSNGKYIIPTDPFIKETFFECRLMEFTPGY